eukprot:CAMPEP_0181169666 /NCGR_PEP_ID=MMETSP1096-20121128/939_1 /TAXON_ID=156174 ORGANISM="Chrysochromulina ericina, Strain CCMP281" /NCGR_SAMPLE_ID=MMETSP1096 /ASSEMBLY_ACC=CAM_ASM_000453 /LENGTH=84 /DNA_ID=CAMNT_0023257145 /DNA_START=416 /DNA_END=671 /DNA_ORIENTATION=-
MSYDAFESTEEEEDVQEGRGELLREKDRRGNPKGAGRRYQEADEAEDGMVEQHLFVDHAVQDAKDGVDPDEGEKPHTGLGDQRM